MVEGLMAAVFGHFCLCFYYQSDERKMRDNMHKSLQLNMNITNRTTDLRSPEQSNFSISLVGSI